MMKPAALIALALVAAPASSASPGGWRALFDGKTTKGWHTYNTHAVRPEWQVIDGALTLTKGGGGDLASDADYAHFELEWEWKISQKGNSGVMYHVVEGPPYPWLTGPEYQLLDNAHLPEGPIEQAGSLFALYPPSKDVTRPTGQWNTSRLVVSATHVEHWLNGVRIVTYKLWSDDFKSRVAHAKFSKMPDYAKAASGRIVLQDHDHEVAFRAIRLRPLP